MHVYLNGIAASGENESRVGNFPVPVGFRVSGNGGDDKSGFGVGDEISFGESGRGRGNGDFRGNS